MIFVGGAKKTNDTTSTTDLEQRWGNQGKKENCPGKSLLVACTVGLKKMPRQNNTSIVFCVALKKVRIKFDLSTTDGIDEGP